MQEFVEGVDTAVVAVMAYMAVKSVSRLSIPEEGGRRGRVEFRRERFSVWVFGAEGEVGRFGGRAWRETSGAG